MAKERHDSHGNGSRLLDSLGNRNEGPREKMLSGRRGYFTMCPDYWVSHEELFRKGRSHGGRWFRRRIRPPASSSVSQLSKRSVWQTRAVPHEPRVPAPLDPSV